MTNLANFDYVARVNRAIDYVTQNLAHPLRLEDVASVACFSPFHFHRIFRSLMGETLASFVKRVRLERALHLLSHRAGASVTEVAFACGFSSSSDFSRAFRAQYGMSPRKFDADEFRRQGRDAIRATVAAPAYQYRPPDGPAASDPGTFEVSVRQLPARHVAYIRVHRPYEGAHVAEAVARLMTWAESRALADGQWLGYQWDDPEIVPLEKCRYDVGLEVPESVRPEGEVSTTAFLPCLIAELPIRGGVDLELRALEWLFAEWLPNSGYAPAHQPLFEAFDGRPFAHGTTHFELRIQMPLVPLDAPLPPLATFSV